MPHADAGKDLIEPSYLIDGETETQSREVSTVTPRLVSGRMRNRIQVSRILALCYFYCPVLPSFPKAETKT